MRLSVTAICCYMISAVVGQDVCYSNVTQPYVMFATKTGYLQVDNENDDPVVVPGCEARSFWLLARHGTRNPGDDDILEMAEKGPEIRDRILENADNGQGSLCDQDLTKFRRWTFNLTEEDDAMLTTSGADEMRLLGQRFRNRFPGLLDQPFARENFTFRHTIKERAAASAVAYAEGAFPGEDVEMDPPLEDDTLLRFYDYCEKWLEEIDENDATYVEQRLFEASDLILNVVQVVNERLGFESEGNLTANDTLSFEDVQLMYDLCRYEKAFYPQSVSIWCSPFQQRDLEILEYHQDLEYWHKNGYAHDLNYQMSCPLLKDAVQIFSQNETSRPLGTFYFSHSEALLPFLGLFSLFRDDSELSHDNYDDMLDRKYKSSRIGSFSGNLALVFYECDEEPVERILAFHQEDRIQLGRCGDVVCGWDEFRDKYQQGISCAFDDICALNTSKSSQDGLSVTPSTVLLVTHVIVMALLASMMPNA